MNRIMKIHLSFLYDFLNFISFPKKLQRAQSNDYRITHLNNFSFPLNGGYFIAGSNQVGVFIIAFL